MGAPPPIRSMWLDRVLDDRSDPIDGYAVAVAASLWSHMNREGVCWPSIRLIAAEAKCNATTVERRVLALERAGYLEVTRRPRRANTYTATVPSVPPGSTDGQRRSGAPVPPGDTEPSDDLSHGGSDLSHHSADLSHRVGSSVPPGHTEPVNPRRGEPLGGPRSAGASQAPPRLTASEIAAKVADAIGTRYSMSTFDAILACYEVAGFPPGTAEKWRDAEPAESLQHIVDHLVAIDVDQELASRILSTFWESRDGD